MVQGRALRSAEEASAYLDGLINRERVVERARARVDLGPIQKLLAAVDHPEASLPVIHVAGSKGKGSVCLLAEAILLALGERTGTFTSPHLERWTERFRLDGREVSGDALARAVERLRPHIDRLCATQPDAAPSFFDATTAAALLIFSESSVDRALVEVGLGGRLDSTNVVQPLVTCITSIELEHTAVLGERLEQIAFEKAGILKAGVPAVVARLPAPAARVVRERAREVGAPLRVEGSHFEVSWRERGAQGAQISFRDDTGFEVEVDVALLGAHQMRNVGLAIACVRALGAHDTDALTAALRAGLATCVLPGRIEVVSRDPWIVIDSAHTAASATALVGVLARLPVETAHLVLSISEGKDLDAIVKALTSERHRGTGGPRVRRVTATRADPERSLAPRDVARAVEAADARIDVRVVSNPRDALRAAYESLGCDELLCVAGSVYLAGIARAVIRDLDSAARSPASGRAATGQSGVR